MDGPLWTTAERCRPVAGEAGEAETDAAAVPSFEGGSLVEVSESCTCSRIPAHHLQ